MVCRQHMTDTPSDNIYTKEMVCRQTLSQYIKTIVAETLLSFIIDNVVFRTILVQLPPTGARHPILSRLVIDVLLVCGKAHAALTIINVAHLLHCLRLYLLLLRCLEFARRPETTRLLGCLFCRRFHFLSCLLDSVCYLPGLLFSLPGSLFSFLFTISSLCFFFSSLSFFFCSFSSASFFFFRSFSSGISKAFAPVNKRAHCGVISGPDGVETPGTRRYLETTLPPLLS